jgi:hypothetical protein
VGRSAPKSDRPAEERQECSTPITRGSRRRRTVFSNTSRSASSTPTSRVRSSASSDLRRRQDVARRSIAEALGASSCACRSAACATRPKIRGHRRTYIGALAGSGHSGPAPCRVEESGLHPRRDRQARSISAATHRRRCSRCSIRSRTTRSGSLPRRAVRLVGGALHHDGQRPRSGARGRSRPHGGSSRSPATPRKKSSRSRSITWSTNR